MKLRDGKQSAAFHALGYQNLHFARCGSAIPASERVTPYSSCECLPFIHFSGRILLFRAE
jgi:hypothetical protein